MKANYKSIIVAISLFFALSTSISAAPGDLDLTFGSGGIVITRDNFPLQLDYSYGMAIQSDGKIVVVGEGSAGTFNWDFAVVRYNTDGSLDSSFGGSGTVITQLTGNYDGASAVAIQADGKIVVAGSIYDGAGGSSFAVVRYNPNGSLDTSFNGTGIVITSVGSSRDYAHSVAIQADGKIVVAGGSGSRNDFALVRYDPNGSLDTTFNGTGKVITPVNVGGAHSVAIQADGKIVAAGGDALVRYNTDGTLDTSFNGTGKVITPIGSYSAAIQTDAKIVVAGMTDEFAVVRYNSNGSLDSSFGGTGQITIPVGNFGSGARSVAIQTDGKIVVTGGASSSNSSDFAVVRLNPNGSLDTAFNGTGKVITPVTIGIDIVTGAAIQADGKIVVAGMSDAFFSDFYDFVLVRYQGDGSTPAACANPIDCPDFFVRQHYQDFFNREPDASGLAYWTDQINYCGSDPQCVEVKRINVSAAYFLSIEFQQTGYLVYRTYKAAYGNLPDAPVPIRFSEFLPDTQQIGHGIVVNQPGWETLLENNKQAFMSEFVQRPRFIASYPLSLTPTQFVDALFVNAGVAPSNTDRAAAINEFGSAMTTSDTAARSHALRRVAENSALQQQELNRAFVLMQYFGYLRRNPNDAPEAGLNFAGYNFWLNKLNFFNGDFAQAEMVKAFIESSEYRRRFGQ